MADPSRYPDSKDDNGTPRWVYVFWIIVIVLVLLFAIMMLTSGGMGGHGPGRHTP